LTVDLPGYDSPAYVEALYEGNKVILHDGNQYSYLEGASVQLTAVVSPITLTSQKPIFAGWAGDLDGFDNPETIIMDENKTVLFKSLMASSPDWNVTMANCVDPYSLPVTTTLNMPNFMPYGLINIAMAADTVTMTASFNVSLPEPAPAGAKWYKCSKSTSCIDFSRDVISGGTGDGAEFNADRTIVTVHLTDNGPYDDNPAYDIILDPSGLGMECLGQNDCSDGLFCNGVETCDEGECIAGSAPCSAQQTCNESNDTCTNPVNPTTTSIPKSGGGGSSGGGGGAAPVTSSSTTSTLVSTTSTSTIPQVNTTTSTSVEPPAPETTTTTSIEEAKCPLQQTLGVEAYAELDALRMFRDTRLARTPSGLLLITLYYAHSQEITAILASYPDLMEQTKGLVIDMLPVIYNATMTDRPLIMTDSQYQKITTLMQAVQSKASPKLSTTITYILEKLESGELIKELN